MKNSLRAILLICVLSGCETEQRSQQQQPPQPQPVAQPHVVHTFAPLPYTGGNLAIDNSTGQKCRTWDWSCGCYSKATEAYDRATKAVESNDSDQSLKAAREGDKLWDQCEKTMIYGMACADIRELPTCVGLQKGTE